MTREELLRLKASLPRTSDDPHYGIELWREDVDALIALALAALDAEGALIKVHEWWQSFDGASGKLTRGATAHFPDGYVQDAIAATREAKGVEG